MIEFLRFVVVETARVSVGLYGLFLMCCIVACINEGIERLVKWFGIQKDKFIRFKTR